MNIIDNNILNQIYKISHNLSENFEIQNIELNNDIKENKNINPYNIGIYLGIKFILDEILENTDIKFDNYKTKYNRPIARKIF